MSQQNTIRENAGDAMNQGTQSPEGTKDMPAPDSNPWGAADPEPRGNDQAAPVGSVQAENAAVHEEAQKAQEYFAGVAGQAGFAGIAESEADGVQGQPSAGQSAGYDTGAPERAREQSDEAGQGDGKEPGTGEMMAGVLSSDPNMEWESKMAEKMSGAEGVTAPSEDGS
ncbi:MAG: hypothetical protein WD627_01445 [Actinomycetota bacterium]